MNKTLDISFRIVLLICALIEIYFLIINSSFLNVSTPLLLILVSVYFLIKNKYKKEK